MAAKPSPLHQLVGALAGAALGYHFAPKTLGQDKSAVLGGLTGFLVGRVVGTPDETSGGVGDVPASAGPVHFMDVELDRLAIDYMDAAKTLRDEYREVVAEDPDVLGFDLPSYPDYEDAEAAFWAEYESMPPGRPSMREYTGFKNRLDAVTNVVRWKAPRVRRPRAPERETYGGGSWRLSSDRAATQPPREAREAEFVSDRDDDLDDDDLDNLISFAPAADKVYTEDDIQFGPSRPTAEGLVSIGNIYRNRS